MPNSNAMKRFVLFLAFILLASSVASARDLVARSPTAQPRSLRTDVADNPPVDPPPGGGGGGEEPPPATDVRGCESCTTLTATETIPTLTNGLTLIGVCQRSATDIITSVSGSVDGALTLVSTANDAANNLVRANLYRLIAPTAGAQVFTVTSSAAQNMAMGIAYFSNVDQTTPLGTITNTAGVNDASTTYSSATQRIVVDHLCAAIPNESSPSQGTGQDQKWLSTAGVASSLSNRQSGMSQKAGAASVDMTWTKPANQAFIQQVIDIRPPGDTGDPPVVCTSCYLINKTFEDSVIVVAGATTVTCCADGVSQEIVTSPVRVGTKALKLSADSSVTRNDTSPQVRADAPSWTWRWSTALNPDDWQLVRAEIQRYGLGVAHGDLERWYGFSVYIPSTWTDTSTDPNGTIISQWHGNNDACEVSKSPHLLIAVTQSMRWRVRTQYDAAACTTSTSVNRVDHDLGAVTTNTWVDWVVYAKWSYTSSGVTKVWKDGKLVLDLTGPNTYNDQNQHFNTIGVYKSWWGISLTGLPATLTAYFDNWRVADSTGSFADVDPSQ